MKSFDETHSLEYRYSAHAGRTVLGTGIAVTTYRNKALVFKDSRILANFNFKINEEQLVRYTKSTSDDRFHLKRSADTEKKPGMP